MRNDDLAAALADAADRIRRGDSQDGCAAATRALEEFEKAESARRCGVQQQDEMLQRSMAALAELGVDLP
jgi:hypothetical protein